MAINWLRRWLEHKPISRGSAPVRKLRSSLQIEQLEDRNLLDVSLISTHAGLGRGGASDNPVLSPDGRYLAFESDGSDLVPGDTNNLRDVFVTDRTTGQTQMISVPAGGGLANGKSEKPVFSPDSRFVFFVSEASNLVAGDTNSKKDVFVFDLQTGTLQLVSANSSGTGTGNNGSDKVAVSPLNNFVLFESEASNLVAGDTNGRKDVFLRTLTITAGGLVLGPTTLVSVSSEGSLGNGNSELHPDAPTDGTRIVFASEASNLVAGDSNSRKDVFIRDLSTGTTTRVSVSSNGVQGTGGSEKGVLSANGRFVLFSSEASNLVVGDSNGRKDLFLRDLLLGVTHLVSANVAGTGSGNNATDKGIFSPNSDFILFESDASNLVAAGLDGNGQKDVFLRSLSFDTVSLTLGATQLVSATSAGVSGNGKSDFHSFSPTDGTRVVFASEASNLVAGDSNGQKDVFVRDLTTGTTSLLSVNATGAASGNGKSEKAILGPSTVVLFVSDASDLVVGDGNSARDVFLRDLSVAVPVTVRVTASTTGNSGGESDKPVFSPDGRYLAFQSEANDILPGDGNGQKDVFLHDLRTGQVLLVSRSLSGGFANGKSDKPVFSPDGRYLAFQSEASNLVADDTNAAKDVFLYELATGTITRVSLGDLGQQGNAGSGNAVFSPDGTMIAFDSEASNLVGGDTNGAKDVFIRDLRHQTTMLVSLTPTGGLANGKSDKPVFSPNGFFLAFFSEANNLVSGDTNGTKDLFLRDLRSGTTILVSAAISGGSGAGKTDEQASFSSDSRYLLFESEADNLVAGDTNGTKDVFLYDLTLGTISLVSTNGSGSGNGKSDKAVFSPDGKAIAFQSEASNLVAGDINGTKDVFLYDVASGTISLVSADSSGTSGNGGSGNPNFSFDGRFIAFASDATNLVAGDTNAFKDIFVRDLARQVTFLLSAPNGGGGSDGKSDKPVFSPNALLVVAFESEADNLVTVGPFGSKDVYAAGFLAVAINPTVLNENDSVILSGTFGDAKPGSHTVVINWGDGTSSTLNLPAGTFSFIMSHTYLDDDPTGTAHDAYTVAVLVTNDVSGATLSAVTTVQLNNVAPTVTLSNGSSPYLGQSITVLAQVVDPGVRDTHTYDWTVTDPSGAVVATGTAPDITFTPTHLGPYTATLIVTDDDGGIGSGSTVIDIDYGPPVIDPSLSLTATDIDEGGSTTLRGSFTDPNPSGSHTVMIDWGDGTSETLNLPAGSTTFSATHTYVDDNPTGTAQDFCTITITLSNTSSGRHSSASTMVSIHNVAPTVHAGPDRTASVGAAVALMGTFTDPGIRDTHTFSWGLTNSAGTVVATGSGPTFTFTPLVADTYIATFTVTDDDTGSGTDTAIITVVTGQPVINDSNLTLSAGTVAEGQPVTLNGSFANADTSTAHTVSISWGDGTPNTVLNLAAGVFSFSAAHVYADDNPTGTASDPYLISVQVTNASNGMSGAASTSVQVNNVAPAVNAGPDQTVTLGTVVTLAGNFADPGTPDTHTITWTVQDPFGTVVATGTDLGVAFVPAQLGVYVATLQVNDDDSGVGTDTVLITVTTSPPGPGQGPGGPPHSGNGNARGARSILVTGTDAGRPAEVKVFDPRNNSLLLHFYAYRPSFTGGVRVAAGDVNGDGIDDILTVTGPGQAAEVKVFDGKDSAVLLHFFALDPFFTGGAFVAAGDVNGDGLCDIIVGADAGGAPLLQVFSGRGGMRLFHFYAHHPLYTGGVRVAGGDVNGDGFADIITATGAGSAARVRIFSGLGGVLVQDYFAHAGAFVGGLFVAAGDVNGDGFADVITGKGVGGASELKVFSGRGQTVLYHFFAHPVPGFSSAIRVGAADLNGDGRADLLTVPGAGSSAQAKAFDAASLAVLDNFFAYDPLFTGGAFLAGGQR